MRPRCKHPGIPRGWHRRQPCPWLWLAAVATALFPAAAHADWHVRPLATGLSYLPPNVDVMVDPAGQVAVGYTLPANGSYSTGSLSLFRLTPTGTATTLTSPSNVAAASFNMDAYGNVYYAAWGGPAFIAGLDTGGWSGLVESSLPASPANIRPTLALDRHGIPTIAGTITSGPTSGQRFLQSYNVPSATWTQTLMPGTPISGTGSYNYQSLTFDTNNHAALAYIPGSGWSPAPLVLARQQSAISWTSSSPATALPLYGTALAAGTAGTVGVAFVDATHALSFATDSGVGFTVETVAPTASFLTPRSLAYDPAGNPALVYADGTLGTLHLARRIGANQWSDQPLPLSARYASLTFDHAGNPCIAAVTTTGVILMGTGISALARADFDTSGAATSADVPAFTQAIRHPSAYLAAHPTLTNTDLQALGDYTGDSAVTDADAHSFLELLPTAPLPGLATRKAGFVAFDNADANPTYGSGVGNFFGTTLATGKPYQAGASRGDLTGPTAGLADNTINAKDIDYLAAAIRAHSTDLRFDLNGDGLINSTDLSDLVLNILSTRFGDATLNGSITLDDYLALDAGYLFHGSGWANGDFNGDGLINAADYALLDASFQQQGAPEAAAMIALHTQWFGDQYATALIPEPATAALLLLGMAGLLRPAHRR